MNRDLPLISIIIPVYNTASYLRECVDSVLNQTYENLEILLIDDGSTDDSGRICDEYASQDSRIVVRHKENRGLAHTRNMGMAMARGEYIMFVDSDDWIDGDMCSAMMAARAEYKVQAVMCSYVREYPGRSLPKTVSPVDLVFDNRTLLRRLCGLEGEELRHPENLDNYNMMCGKIYPASALKGICVTDNKLIGPSEDLLFNLESFAVIDSMVYINRSCYHYRRSIVTSISGAYKPELEKQWNHLYDTIARFIADNCLGEGYAAALNNRIALNVLGLGINCLQGREGFLKKYKNLNRVITTPRRRAALKQLPLKHMPLHWKLFYFSARHKLTLLLYLLLIGITHLRGKV